MFDLVVKMQCPTCGQVYEFDTKSFPDAHVCGVCSAEFALPDKVKVVNRMSKDFNYDCNSNGGNSGASSKESRKIGRRRRRKEV